LTAIYWAKVNVSRRKIMFLILFAREFRRTLVTKGLHAFRKILSVAKLGLRVRL
jgi:hypothetical protein